MPRNLSLQRVFVPADPVQGEAVQAALREAGIDARMVVEDDGQGGLAMEIVVPTGEAARARKIIAAGSFPRLA